MKQVFVQIPCLNEEATIGEVILSIPRQMTVGGEAFSVHVVVIDDGSTDGSREAARSAGAEHVISHIAPMGLAATFRDGIEYCLRHGADFIVNTDGDDQYDQREIPRLLEPLAARHADMVIGDRQIARLTHMPMQKKVGNHIGSWTIRFLTGLQIPDASSGFRSFTREAALKFNLISRHTYTHETIIQARDKYLTVASVPVAFRARMHGQSRLIGGIWDHVKKSGATIFRSVLMYKAFTYLTRIGAACMGVGVLVAVRFLYFFFTGRGTGHVQSLILASVVLNVGFITIVLGIIADLTSVNRKLLEDIKNDMKEKLYAPDGNFPPHRR